MEVVEQQQKELFIPIITSTAPSQRVAPSSFLKKKMKKRILLRLSRAGAGTLDQESVTQIIKLSQDL